MLKTAPSRAAAGLLRVYQVTLSPLKRLILGPGAACRFYPTCSEYMRVAILKHGLFSGTWMGTKRLCKCHPLHPGGYDPVPAKCCQENVPETAQ